MTKMIITVILFNKEKLHWLHITKQKFKEANI